MPTPQKIPCSVGEILAHGQQVYSLELIPAQPVPRFKPGQFLHLALDAYDPSGFWPDSRVFSIASAPHSREKLKISYAVKGKFTKRMEKELRPGGQVWIKMPYGDFAVDDSRPVVLIAGGTGITAFTSFLESVSGANSNPVTVFYGARLKPLLIYKELLDEKIRNTQNLTAFYFIEQSDEWGENEIKGLLSVEAIWKRLEAPLAQSYYISGPPAMLRQFIEALTRKGINSAAIHIDAWD